MVTSDLIHVDGLPPLHAFQWETVRNGLNSLNSGKSTTIALPGPSIFPFVVGYAALLDYAEWAMSREDFLNRPTFGLLMPLKRMGSLFSPVTVSGVFIEETSRKRQWHAMREKNASLNLDDPRWGYIYWSHWLNVRYKKNVPERLPLWYLFPAARIVSPEQGLKIDHPRNHLGKYDYQPPSYLIADNPNHFMSYSVLGVIVDLNWWDGDVAELNSIGIPVLTLWSDPLDPRIPDVLTSSSGPIIFDREAAKAAETDCQVCKGGQFPFESERAQILTAQPLVSWEIIRNPQIEEGFSEINRLLRELSKLFGPSETSTLLRYKQAAYWLRSILRNLVVPLRNFDEVSAGSPFHRTTLDLVGLLDELATVLHERDHFLGAIAEDINQAFNNLIRLFEVEVPPKHQFVNYLVQEQYYQGLSSTVIVQSSIHRQALIRPLADLLGEREEELPEVGVHVVTVGESRAQPVDLAIITSIGQGLLATCLSGMSRKFQFLCFPDEISALISRQQRPFGQIARLRESIRTAFEKWVGPFIPTHIELTEEVSEENEIDDGMKGMRPLGYASWSPEDDGDTTEITAFRFWSNDMFVYIPENSRVRVVDRLDRSLRQVSAGSVGVGSVLVTIRGSVRDSFYDILIELLHDTPEIKEHIQNIQLWHTELRTHYRKQRHWLSYPEILSRIGRLGSSIQSTDTIRNWIKAEVMGPEDSEDVRRMGEVLGSEVLKTNWKTIANSLEKIRNLHREVAKELNEIIFGVQRTEFRHPLLRDSGISPRDFQGALEFIEITKVERPRSVRPNLIGILLGGEASP